MSHARDMARHSGSLYRRLLRRAESGVEKVEDEARHLRDVEERGEAGSTPFIAFGGLILFLIPFFLIILGLALAAYYLAK